MSLLSRPGGFHTPKEIRWHIRRGNGIDGHDTRNGKVYPQNVAFSSPRQRRDEKVSRSRVNGNPNESLQSKS